MVNGVYFMQIIMATIMLLLFYKRPIFLQTDWLAKFWCYYICGDLLTGGTYLKASTKENQAKLSVVRSQIYLNLPP